jgi:hypothetical protein
MSASGEKQTFAQSFTRGLDLTKRLSKPFSQSAWIKKVELVSQAGAFYEMLCHA